MLILTRCAMCSERSTGVRALGLEIDGTAIRGTQLTQLPATQLPLLAYFIQGFHIGTDEDIGFGKKASI